MPVTAKPAIAPPGVPSVSAVPRPATAISTPALPTAAEPSRSAMPSALRRPNPIARLKAASPAGASPTGASVSVRM